MKQKSYFYFMHNIIIGIFRIKIVRVAGRKALKENDINRKGGICNG